jgi:hypothetical protein
VSIHYLDEGLEDDGMSPEFKRQIRQERYSRLHQCLNSVQVIGRVIEEFTVERSSPNCPKWMSSEWIYGGLSTAVVLLADEAEAIANLLEEEE